MSVSQFLNGTEDLKSGQVKVFAMRDLSLPVCPFYQRPHTETSHSLCVSPKDLIQRPVTPCVSPPKTSYRDQSLPCYQRPHTETGHSLCVATKDLIKRQVTPCVSLPKTLHRDRSLPVCPYQRPHTETGQKSEDHNTPASGWRRLGKTH